MTEQGRGGGGPAVEAFLARWGASAGAERANYQIFLAELCDLLGVPRPDPSVADEAANRYVFDKAVTFQNPDGKTSTGYIDLYKKGAFVCETKQSVAREAKDPLSVADPAAPKARRKSGTSVRGTAGWDDSMIAARGQAEGYVRALPDDNPPFLLVRDPRAARGPQPRAGRRGKAWPDPLAAARVSGQGCSRRRAAGTRRGR